MALPQAIVDGFLAHLDEFTHQGVQAQRRGSPYGSAGLGMVQETWDLTYEAESVGTVQRSLKQHNHGHWFVEHDDLHVWGDRRPPELSGFGAAMLSWEEARYRELECGYILLDAHGTGAYLWASLGFEFADGHEVAHGEAGAIAASKTLTSERALVALAELSELDSERVKLFTARIYDGALRDDTFTSPGDIVAFDIHPGRAFVKRVLPCTTWRGIRLL